MPVEAYGPAPPSVGIETSESADRIRVVRCVRLKGVARGLEPMPGAAPEGRTSLEDRSQCSARSAGKLTPGSRGPDAGQDVSHGQVDHVGKGTRRGPSGAQSQHRAPPRTARVSQGVMDWARSDPGGAPPGEQGPGPRWVGCRSPSHERVRGRAGGGPRLSHTPHARSVASHYRAGRRNRPTGQGRGRASRSYRQSRTESNGPGARSRQGPSGA